MMQIEALLGKVLARLDTLEQKIDILGDKFDKMNVQEASKKQKNALRRQIYREKMQEIKKGQLTLPEHHCMMRRDARVDTKVYLEWGIKYGRANQPYQYLEKLVHHWNTKVYLKKPVTYSGSSFRIWNGTCRVSRGPGDLMHFYRKRVRNTGKFIRNPGELYDFHRRPWFRWGTKVLCPIIMDLKEHEEWDSFDDHFKLAVQLLCGGIAELKIDGIFWDLDHDADTLNKLIRRVSNTWHKVLESCLNGLRTK